jgi:hypothetical protein
MMKRPWIAAFASLLWATGAQADPSARYPSDQPDVQLIVFCDRALIRKDYTAETQSGVPLTEPYAVTRGADKGLVHLMNQGGRQIRRYVIPRRLMRGIVTIKYDAIEADRADLIFTKAGLTLVHTYATNAGIFTASDVFQLSERRPGVWDEALLKGDEQLLTLLHAGLAFARAAGPQCGLDR